MQLKMTTKDELQKIVTEQEERLSIYERKLRDVVRAYKSIESEKKALETALSVISHDPPSSNQSVPDVEYTKEEDQIIALKKALTTLTIENKQKELAFQSDKKVLKRKNEELKLQLETLNTNFDQQPSVQKIKEQLIEIKSKYEKVSADYIKEKKLSEELGRNVAELSQWLCDKDELLSQMQTQLKEAPRREQELRKKYESNPTVKIMQEQINNAKKSHSKEMDMINQRYNFQLVTINNHEKRNEMLEKRISELMDQGAASEQKSLELLNNIHHLKQQLDMAKNENEKLHNNRVMESSDREGIPIIQLQPKQSTLCVPDQASKFPTDTGAKETTDDSPISTGACQQGLPNMALCLGSCNNCGNYLRELDHYKSLTDQINGKLLIMEEDQRRRETEQNSLAHVLKKRILELESDREQSCLKFQVESKNKVAEIEEEMTNQRSRFMELFREKDREIEHTKKKLLAICGRNMADIDPDDPWESTEKSLDTTSVTSNQDNLNILPNKMTSTTTRRKLFHGDHLSESKNFYYEQELAKMKHEAEELRNVIQLLESRSKDVEQSSLMKDIHYLQIIETLKEEILIFEGRISLGGSDSQTNMSYLRNIFIELLNSRVNKDRKSILKAIGTVLQLTPKEIKKIDAWNH